MKNHEISVVYQWTAKSGNSEQLKSIYRQVVKEMKETEPNTLRADCFYDETTNTLIVHDVFADPNALGQHLGVTAAAHFQELLQIANPGPFLFLGAVPEELQQAAIGMGLQATFAPFGFGFER